ncbi:hypothetical protein JWJ90_21030 [Desulfobulbus rhabdoformis]|uniref:hypothetical protein n=1 Tax=Desulfobulbus rhabdoformis TaxID=34032 RepID=UPI0019647987|nr:hypothetical protein [Desulfobulbus rhabdoformis]MBM9616752.1 hypothetical protein [Desulfobulbus rhabdoformis]
MKYLALVLCTIITLNSQVFGETTYDKNDISLFREILERAATTTKTDDWKFNGISDNKLKSSLVQLVTRVREIANNPNIELPVTFDSVNSAISQNNHLNKKLLVTKRGKVSFADNSIIIADESIEIGHANNCIVIAQGAVDISHGSRNLIIAGNYINIAHDNNDPYSSILISGAVVDISHADGSIICAPLAVKISHANNITLINSPILYVSYEKNTIQRIDKSKILPNQPVQKEWLDALNITQIVPQNRYQKALIIVRNTDIEMVMRIGDNIPNIKEELKGWKLVLVGNGFVMFENNGIYASRFINLKGKK